MLIDLGIFEITKDETGKYFVNNNLEGIQNSFSELKEVLYWIEKQVKQVEDY